MTATSSIILQVQNLVKHFPILGESVFAKAMGAVRAVDGVSFTVYQGETFGLVGESGCGKTTLGRCILQLERPTAGQVIFAGQELTGLTEARLRVIRRQMQVIFQDPYSSLNPRMSVGQMLAEPLQVHGMEPRRAGRRQRVAELLAEVGLPPALTERYPHELSGGQRQRVGIARALAMQPAFIVCDEPVSALDVSIQAQIINVLDDLQERYGLTYLFVAHDLSVVRHISDPEVEAHRERIILRGEVPSPANPPAGCVFHPRCPMAIADCRHIVPEFREVKPGHWAACIRV